MPGILSMALVMFFATSAPPLQAAPTFTGTWAGPVVITVDGKATGESEYVHVVLKQAGDVVSGTAGESADHQYPIRNGKMTTAKDVTTVMFEFIANGVHSSFSLRPIDGNLKGDVRIVGEDGHVHRATADLKPVK